MGLDISHSIPVYKTSPEEMSDYFTVEELSDCPHYLQRHSRFICGIADEEGTCKKVICFLNVGNQRKGMKRSFYTDFQNGKVYMDLEVF